MLEGALSAPEVVYAIIRDQNGSSLVAKSKGNLLNIAGVIRDNSHPLLPDETHTAALSTRSSSSTQDSQPLITVLHTAVSHGRVSLQAESHTPPGRSQSVFHETIYDFALPVYRQTRQSRTTDFLSSETLSPSSTEQPAAASPSSV